MNSPQRGFGHDQRVVLFYNPSTAQLINQAQEIGDHLK